MVLLLGQETSEWTGNCPYVCQDHRRPSSKSDISPSFLHYFKVVLVEVFAFPPLL
jgi:hypothetical protein